MARCRYLGIEATGMSSRLLAKVKNYAEERGQLEFIEVFFNTLAMHHNLPSRVFYHSFTFVTIGAARKLSDGVTARTTPGEIIGFIH